MTLVEQKFFLAIDSYYQRSYSSQTPYFFSTIPLLISDLDTFNPRYTQLHISFARPLACTNCNYTFQTSTRWRIDITRSFPRRPAGVNEQRVANIRTSRLSMGSRAVFGTIKAGASFRFRNSALSLRRHPKVWPDSAQNFALIEAKFVMRMFVYTIKGELVMFLRLYCEIEWCSPMKIGF